MFFILFVYFGYMFSFLYLFYSHFVFCCAFKFLPFIYFHFYFPLLGACPIQANINTHTHPHTHTNMLCIYFPFGKGVTLPPACMHAAFHLARGFFIKLFTLILAKCWKRSAAQRASKLSSLCNGNGKMYLVWVST